MDNKLKKIKIDSREYSSMASHPRAISILSRYNTRPTRKSSTTQDTTHTRIARNHTSCSFFVKRLRQFVAMRLDDKIRPQFATARLSFSFIISFFISSRAITNIKSTFQRYTTRTIS